MLQRTQFAFACVFALAALVSFSSSCGVLNALSGTTDDGDDGDDDGNPREGEGEGEGEGEPSEGEGEGEGEPLDPSCHGGALLTATHISVGFDRSCALTCSGVVCWGSGSEQEIPARNYIDVAVGQEFACGLDDNGALSCWGFASHIVDEPIVSFASIEAGQDFICGLSSSGVLECYGEGGWPSFEAPSGVFAELAVGWGYVCGKRLDTGAVQCGGTTPRHVPPPATSLSNIDVGSRFACGLDAAGAIVCFDNENDSFPFVPTGTFSKIGVGDGTACAIAANDAHLVCFTDTLEGEIVVEETPTAGRFIDIAVGDSHACAIRDDNVVLCWGNDSQDRTAVPPAP